MRSSDVQVHTYLELSEGPTRVKPGGDHAGVLTTPRLRDGCYEFGYKGKSTDQILMSRETLPDEASVRAYMRENDMEIRMGRPGIPASFISETSLTWHDSD